MKRRGDSGGEICGSNGRRVQARAARGSRKAEPRRNSFTREKREAFLGHFAATCNANAAARVAGVSKSTIYAWRRKDEQFRRGWEEALDQGYARLEAEAVREAERSLRVRANEKAARQRMDPKVALAVLEAYRRNRGARPGDILPQASDAEQVRARIEKTMRTLGLIRDEGPSAASPSPSTGHPGEGE